jgi:hypothetical protein
VNSRRATALLGAAAVSLLLLNACGSGSNNSSSPSEKAACTPLQPPSAPGFLPQLTQFLNDGCYKSWQHDANVRSSQGVHPYVQVYYSPNIWTWLTNGDRSARIIDGSTMVKAQYKNEDGTGFMDWTVMIKDSSVWDTWYWADIGVNPLPPVPVTNGCSEPTPVYTGYGLYCLNCHSTAADGQGTYATTSHVAGGGTSGSMQDFAIRPTSNSSSATEFNPLEYLHQGNFASRKDESGSTRNPLTAPQCSTVFPQQQAPRQSYCMVSETYDHVVPYGRPAGPQQFLTSDQCAGCHDATGTISDTGRADIPAMLYPNALQTCDPGSNPPTNCKVNVSPNGEWRYSMMGLSGRDPIFLAQLETERTIHPQLSGQPNAADLIDDTCLRCHGVLGERQYKIDTNGGLLTHAALSDPNSRYGALARDGVSCDGCHHIAADGLGTEATYTGLFNVGPATELYGPYAQVATLPMQNAIGVNPQFASQVQSSLLCSSCHTIFLPVYDKNGNQPLDEHGAPKVSHEQTTFLEWVNSNFADKGSTPQSCQDCHMPKQYKGQPLAFNIANIEDNTFPPELFRAPDDQIQLTKRTDFARHTLLGINVFALEMFGEFRSELGLYAADPMLPNGGKDIFASQYTAINSGLEVASSSATVKVLSLQNTGSALQADVQVVNLAGHSFPSGVSFRRAFLEFRVLDALGNTLWVSGQTSNDGVILDNAGNPLVTEFFAPNQQAYQPHYNRANPITRDDQVQIYEELALNPEGQLTTSFLALDEVVKNNRLLPQGWSATGPSADMTKPVGVNGDPTYSDGSGSSVVRYAIPLSSQLANAASVVATLYYQSIPPYYLRQRADSASGDDTARLKNMVCYLNVNGTNSPIPNWRLPIAKASAALAGGSFPVLKASR